MQEARAAANSLLKIQRKPLYVSQFFSWKILSATTSDELRTPFTLGEQTPVEGLADFDGGTHIAVSITRDRFEECIGLLRYTDRL